MKTKADIFEFINDRVGELGDSTGLRMPQAFGRWFLEMYFLNPRDIFVSDGSKDGKVDVFCTTHNGRAVEHHVVNSKFTKEYNKIAPVSFYHEITYFWRAFDNADTRSTYLEQAVKPELRARFKKLFESYDEEAADLIFATNHRRNDAHFHLVKKLPVRIFHLDDLIQHVLDDIDAAMPRTPELLLSGIQNVLSPDKSDTEVSTSIVFARLIDFIKYMERDPHEMLFARNVRLTLGNTPVNKAIRETFRTEPREFAFSNNGITMLCEKHTHDPGSKELRIENPRVVNGSQTLHSVRDVPSPAPNARVMVRIIEIPAVAGTDVPAQVARKREIVNKISIRSNQQNPIKRWNLVANDDFQIAVYRFFRAKGLFYERREKEWSYRSRELRSSGIARGPSIKFLAQLIAAYHWNTPKLGPANARSNVAELFAGGTYELIRRTPLEAVYQVYLLDGLIYRAVKALAARRAYIENMRGYVDMTLLALISRALQSCGAKFDDAAFSKFLEGQDANWNETKERWMSLARQSLDYIRAAFRKQGQIFRRKERTDLTIANFFKAMGYVQPIVTGSVPRSVRSAARALLSNG